MNNLNDISNIIFKEFGTDGKSVAVQSEGNVLLVKIGNSDTRIFNWQSIPIQSILDTARSLTIKEDFKGNVILHG